jgi:hypothetical protein
MRGLNLQQPVVSLGAAAVVLLFCASESFAQVQPDQNLVPELRSTTPPCRQSVNGSVVFNLKSHKYHDPRCVWAVRCTSNCVSMPLAQVQAQGGIPCSYCLGAATTGVTPRNQINPRAVTSTAASVRIVTYNRNSHKYHNPRCAAAIRCTSSCEDIPYNQAIERGAIPCQLCGGGL